MKVGLIARAENRGLGIQTMEWYRHMAPDRVLVVDSSRLGDGHPMHLDRYPGATITPMDGARNLVPGLVRAFLDGLDVVYTAETFYDERLPAWAADVGCRLVVHVNPEFHRWGPLPGVTWWTPTSWRVDQLGVESRAVPVPVPTDRWPYPTKGRPDPVFLHVVGHKAARDRNGTAVLFAALRHVRQPIRVRVITQGRQLPSAAFGSRRVHLEGIRGGIPDYWRLYDDADVLALPRRYGGLCLPALEAAGAGLAIVMPDVSPNRDWPGVRFPAVADASKLAAPCGTIDVAAPNPRDLARALDSLADPQLRHQVQAASLTWARAHSWGQLAPLIRRELELAAE